MISLRKTLQCTQREKEDEKVEGGRKKLCYGENRGNMERKERKGKKKKVKWHGLLTVLKICIVCDVTTAAEKIEDDWEEKER